MKCKCWSTEFYEIRICTNYYCKYCLKCDNKITNI